MDESCFVLSLPITPYRYFKRAEVVRDRRVLVGLDAIFRDICSLHMFLRDIGRGAVTAHHDLEVSFECTIINGVSNEDALMGQWYWRSLNAMARGAKCEVSVSTC